MDIITRQEAKCLGLMHYFTGRPCIRGHVEKRLVSVYKCLGCNRERSRRWRKEHPTETGTTWRQWRDAKLERQESAREAVRKWDAIHRDARAAIKARRRAKEKSAPGTFTENDIKRLIQLQNGYCAVVNCNESILKVRHVDHIIPISRGGSNWPSNIQLLCPLHNHKKAAKDPLDFAREQGFAT